MPKRPALSGKSILACAMLFALLAGSAEAKGIQVLHDFAGGSDGRLPSAYLVRDRDSNLYGTTQNGGTADLGTVFFVRPDGGEGIVHSFTGSGDGSSPTTGLVLDSSGNLFGTTAGGGSDGLGTVFKIAPGGQETWLYSFKGICCGRSDGSFPYGDLIMGRDGNLYGTTEKGGNASDYGTVFMITTAGVETVLYAFNGGNDGRYPSGALLRDRRGDLYGTTRQGGPSNAGTVFKIPAQGTEMVLHAFTGSDGEAPYAGLIMDSQGNLCGTTAFSGPGGEGTVFKLAPDGTETVLHGFTGGSDGGTPYAGVIADTAGDLLGVTSGGGNSSRLGTLFEVTPDGQETVLHTFTGYDGSYPDGGLIVDRRGNLYGTALQGGLNNQGTVFKMKSP